MTSITTLNNFPTGTMDDVESHTSDDVPPLILPSTDNANNVSSPNTQPSGKLPSAPEPPRWRFVNEAKKSLGYSSVHAGSYIKGQSSNDLGAKYVAPDISLYSPKEEKVRPKKVEFQLPTNKSLVKEDLDVGKLDASVPSQNNVLNENNGVGKLSIRGDSATYDGVSLPSGTFAGLPKSKSQRNESRKPFKEWDTSLQVGPKNDRPMHVWYDGEVHDSYTMPNGQDSSKTQHVEVRKLKFHRNGSGEEAFLGEIPKSNRGHGDGRGDYDSQDSDDAPREGALFVHSGSTNNGKGSDADSTALTEPIDGDTKKNHKWPYLLVFFLLALVVILGVLLGTRDDDESRAAVGAVGGIMLPPIVVLNSTSVPSSYPSASLPFLTQTLECPVDTKPFSIKNIQSSNYSLAPTIKDATWKIKDACSGEVITQCEPCSLASMFQTQPEDLTSSQSENNDGPTRYLEDMRLGNITECLPIDNEYVLEILPTTKSEPCCAFDPATSIMAYDNVLVNYGASEGSLNNMYFGERETPCKSETPSVSPTIEESAPTNSPNPQPTCSTEQEFNLCLAIDMSGSVCNNGIGAECIGCRAAFLPIFFNSECRDSFVSEDTCCNNFANVKEFSSLIVNLLGDFPAEKSFSVVQFATNAQLVSGLNSAEQTVPVIDRLDYTGGLTNHASAIQTCQRTLSSSEGSKKKFIMLITDGVSSEPDFDPEGAAETAATSAKSDGTFIIPVFISPDNDLSALSFMRRLSSDGKVFDVTDFDSLNSLQDRLIDQVSCA